MAPKRRQDVLMALRGYCASTDLSPGARLPPERDLATHLGCSRATLRWALAELERGGEIWRHVGQGTFLAPRPIGHPVRDSLLAQAASPFHLMQVRLMLEPAAAALAACEATPAQTAYIAVLIEQGRHATRRSECERLDAAFHRSIAEVTGNPVLLALLDQLAHVRRHGAWQREWEHIYRHLGVEEFTHRHCDQHEEVLACIQSRQAEAASRAMRLHLEDIAAAIREVRSSACGI